MVAVRFRRGVVQRPVFLFVSTMFLAFAFLYKLIISTKDFKKPLLVKDVLNSTDSCPRSNVSSTLFCFTNAKNTLFSCTSLVYHSFRTATLERPGSFAVKGVRAPSTESFVSNKNRKKVEAKIQEIGEDYGCHKCEAGHPFYQRFYHFFCGEFKKIDYLPDRTCIHSRWRVKIVKYFGGEMLEKFYPQCSACAAKQKPKKLLSLIPVR